MPAITRAAPGKAHPLHRDLRERDHAGRPGRHPGFRRADQVGGPGGAISRCAAAPVVPIVCPAGAMSPMAPALFF